MTTARQDQVSGRRDDRPGLAACLKALRGNSNGLGAACATWSTWSTSSRAAEWG